MPAKIQLKRWVCSGGHPGVHAPSRLRKNDVRRFCWPCSQATGVLVERTCPALEKKRAAKRKAAPKSREAVPKKRTARERHMQRSRTTQERACQPRGSVQNPWEELNRLQDLECVQKAFEASERSRVLILNVQSRKEGTGIRGLSYRHIPKISLGVAPDAAPGLVEAVLAHEVAHSCVPKTENHGPGWQRMFMKILVEGYGMDVEWPRGLAYREAHVKVFNKVKEHFNDR